MQSVVTSQTALPTMQTGGAREGGGRRDEPRSARQHFQDYYRRHSRHLSNTDSISSVDLQMTPSSTPTTDSTAPSASKKRNSFLAKTFRSFSSSSSLDRMAEEPAPSNGTKTSTRRLQKTPTNGSSSIFHRLSRRTSNNSNTSSQASDNSGRLASMKVIKHGPLKTDTKLWKSRAEYLVLTDSCIIKFSSVDGAKAAFAEIGGATNAVGTASVTAAPASHRLSRSSTVTSLSGFDGGSYEARVEIPLNRVVNMFNEEGLSPHFGLDVWWAEAPPMVSWTNLKLFFAMPQERDDWMAQIRRTMREANVGKTGVSDGIVSPNVETRIHSIVAAEEPSCSGSPLDIFPVVQRTFPLRSKSDSSEALKKPRDASSYYLLLGRNKCYLVRILRTSVYKAPKDLDVTVASFGLTSVVRVKATMAPHEERFVLSFRLPCESVKRLDLASRWYREIVMTFMKADRVVKPAWPQHLQNDIFDIRGLTNQLHLPSGQDFGGLERTLEAYCVAYGCEIPAWTASWKCERREHNPEFRLLPSPKDTKPYSAYQLLAVFKALRYNDYFRSLSFRDVDFAPLCGWCDLTKFHDSVADVSRDGMVIDTVHKEMLRSAPIMFQELHAITFTSGSIRKIDLTNVLKSKRRLSASARFQPSHAAAQQPAVIEVARPILLLMRTQNISLDALSIAGNALSPAEIAELVSMLCIPGIVSELDISRCNLDEKNLAEIWDALPNQSRTMEVLNTSRNYGNVDHVVMRNSLAFFSCLRKLDVAGNCLTQFTDFLFYDETIMTWQLEELDLSDIKLSEETVNVLATYLAMPESDYMRKLNLNNCGLTGTMAAILFRSMGQGREIICSVSGNYLEDGGDEMVNSIGYNFGPRALFIDMVEYRLEENFVKLIRALAVNKTILLLSLVGTATPGQVSEVACAAVSDFFATNQCVQYLDFSGFSAKLDEGQLGLGFSQSLAGLAQNTTLQHLRICNQKLNINIGDLATAIAKNTTLQTLDVQENGFNLSNLTHMVRSLEENRSIQEFRPFSEAELNRTIRSTMQKVEMPPPQQPEHQRRRLSSKAAMSMRSGHAQTDDANKLLVEDLRRQWKVKMDHIEEILLRNRAANLVVASSGGSILQGLPEDGPREYYFAGHLPLMFGGLALIQYESTTPTAVDLQSGGLSSLEGALPQVPLSPLSLAVDGGMLPVLEKLDTAPHHVTRDEVMESPIAEDGSDEEPYSRFSTPPEWADKPSAANNVAPLSPNPLGTLPESRSADAAFIESTTLKA